MSSCAAFLMTFVTILGQAPAATAPSVSPQPAPIFTPGSKLYVNASGLAFRRGPSLDTERIHYIKRGDQVTVLEDNRVPVSFEAEGIKGHWLYVQHGAYKGYVFDGFLSPDPPPLDTRIDWTFVPGARVGPITADTDYDALVSIFGAENVTDALVNLGEGETEPGTAVLTNTPNALVIQWLVYRKQPKAVYILREGSRWKSLDGIGIDTPLSTLVRLNGRPVSFAGFDWDNSGYVTSWNGGALERSYTLGSRFELNLVAPDPHPDEYLAFRGDTVFSSDLAAVGRLNLRINRIIVHLGAKPDQPATTKATTSHPLRTYGTGTQYYVLASKLNMRARPELGADLVTGVPYGARVVIAPNAEADVPLVSEGMPGQWVAVDFSGLRGFVFDAYLSPLPAPDRASSGLAEYAHAMLTPAARSADDGASVTYQGGARLETEGQTSTSLVVPGASIPQAFVLAKRAVPAFAGSEFKTDAAGAVHLENGSLTMTVQPEPDGSARITVERGVNALAP